ncbi:MAG TPA: HlyD family efflux transporter periplasmic adaptor subunit, partial [Chloroflexota bacterium]|nr:HlyD family efflux transporter periplasmic adaptor subunit [Chloroflexota bacterium]
LVAAQVAVDSAKAKLNQLTQGLPRTEDVHAAELEVERARTALDGAVAERNAAAARRPPLSRPELEQLDASVRAAQLGVEVAQNALQRARAGATDWDIRQAQLAVDQAQTNVQKLKSPSPAEIGEAVASVEQARANLDKVAQAVRSELETALAGVDQAQATLDKLRSPSEHDLAAAQEAVRQAEAQLEKARGATNSDLAAARAAADQARANLDRTMATKPLDVQVAQRAVEQARAQLQLKQAGPTPADIESAQAKVAQAETSLEQARRHLAEVSLVAPFSGTVTQVNARQGEQTGPNAVAVVLADLSGFFVETRDLDELAAARVEMGQPVRVTINALERTLEGTVTSISPQATVTEAGDTYYVTTIGLTKPDPGLRWGQTVKVEFGTR